MQYPRPMSPKEFLNRRWGHFQFLFKTVPQEDIGILKERFLMFLSEFSRVPCFECAHINILSPYNFPSLLQRQQSVFDLKGPVDL